MKRRICTIITGLGGNSKSILTNNGEIDKEFGAEATKEYCKKWGGFDFQIEDKKLMIGIEASYMYDKVKIITIHKNKELSSITTGYCVGAYGSDVLSQSKHYIDYKYKCKFTNFIDKWHKEIF